MSVSIADISELNSVVDDLVTDIKAALKTKSIKRRTKYRGGFSSIPFASGKLYDSVRKEIDETEIRIYTLNYIQELIYGKPPQRDGVQVTELEEWLAIKGLSSFGTQIAENINTRGNSIWQEHSGADSGLLAGILENGILNKDILENIKSKIQTSSINELTERMMEKFRSAA